MEDKKILTVDEEYHDFIYNIRQTMQIVQGQFEVMNAAIEKCSSITTEDLVECYGAMDIAHKEILRFLELNVKLAKLIDDFRSFIAKKMNL